MSGICGWLGATSDQDEAPAIVDRMQRALRDHEGEAPASIVRGGSAVAAQAGVRPSLAQQSDDLLCALEGRVRWRRAELAMLAAERGPCVALAEAYRRYGAACLDEMSGPFAAAVVDTKDASGLIAIDRLGTRTLCYAHSRGALVFGSNATSVIAHPAVGRSLSRQAIFNYLYCHVIPSPGTIYSAVRKLQPGECVTLRDGKFENRFYWRLDYHDEDKVAVDELEERLRSSLKGAVGRAIDGASNVGAFLSGGTDSSTVAAMFAALTGEPPRTYSLGFAWEGFDEMKYARITARHLGARAREYYVTPQDIVEAIPVIARAYDEPFGNDSAAPTYVCARMARADGIDTLLAGDGGDEIFGGNTRYAKQKLFEAYGAIPGALRRGLVEPLAFALPGHERITPLRKLGSYIRQAAVPLPDRLETYNFLNRAPLADIFEPDFLSAVDPDEPLEMLREVYRRTASSSPVNRMMHLDLKITLADNDLRKVSRMCDIAGVDVRYPMLDDDLVELSGEIPSALKVKGFRLRWFFKRALKDVLAPETIAKTKHGFGMPFGPWLNAHAPLADLVYGSLDAFRRRGILRPAYIDTVRHSHQADHATYFGIMIWVIALLECWLAERQL
ncbi:MAG TPA: asparagine synthase-related protein [Casimicrobiaceae bacterium]|nr:asparagine synthase-related protein [Casimicrobiaceae bacterium]